MSKDVIRQKVMIELEEKAKRKALTNFIEKLAEIDKLKREGRYEEPIPPVKKQLTSEEILERIEQGRKERFQEDKKAVEHTAKTRRGKPQKIWEPEPKEPFLGVMYPVESSVLAVLYEGEVLKISRLAFFEEWAKHTKFDRKEELFKYVVTFIKCSLSDEGVQNLKDNISRISSKIGQRYEKCHCKKNVFLSKFSSWLEKDDFEFVIIGQGDDLLNIVGSGGSGKDFDIKLYFN